ncbi:molybdate ABC transporter permease subunit [Methylothermus subterraneus]|nr:molybdate transport system permease protein [uncultured Gammaproteobacteria bacterium]
MNFDWQPLVLSFKLAGVTSAVLQLLGTPIAYWLASSRGRLKPVLEAALAMPLVLPPTVLGFYLLVAFSPQGALGAFLDKVFGLRLVFSFEGLVVASVIATLPFQVQPVQAGFESLPKSLREVAYTLGLSRWQTFWRVLLPNVKPALLAGAVLSFAHTVGEFGVVLMIGGSLPGVTRVASIAIYDEVAALNYAAAHVYALTLVAFCFAVLLLAYALKLRQWRDCP